MRAARYPRVARGCCWAGDNFLAITKKCFEVGGYVQRWEGAACGYQKKFGAPLWVPQPCVAVASVLRLVLPEVKRAGACSYMGPAGVCPETPALSACK